jgi:hypothetical protein
MTIINRLEALEANAGTTGPGAWFDLAVWRQEQAAGVPLDEQERRRLVEYPAHVEAIRDHYAKARYRLTSLTALGVVLGNILGSDPVNEDQLTEALEGARDGH